MRLKIQHVTRYSYPAPVCDNHNELRLMPLNDDRQTCVDFWAATSPLTHIFYYNLPTGRVHHFNVRPEHRQLTVTATSHVLTQPVDAVADLPFGGGGLDFYRVDSIREDYAEYLMATSRVPDHLDVESLVQVARSGAETNDAASFLMSLNRVIHRVLAYKKGATEVDTPLEDVLASREGVCQDFAHLMLAVCRRVGIPARYTSGYLYTRRADRQGLDMLGDTGEKALEELGIGRSLALVRAGGAMAELIDGDAMHAWVECLLPDNRWHGFDPTNCLVTNDVYVRVHYGRDYGDVVPLRGVYAGPQARKLEVSVSVTDEDAQDAAAP